MNEVVKNSSSLSRVEVPLLTKQEYDFFIFVLTLIKDSIRNDSKNIRNTCITLYPKDLERFFNKSITRQEFDEVINMFKSKIFKANFTGLVRDGDLVGNVTSYIFSSFTAYERPIKKTKRTKEINDQFNVFERIEIETTPFFYYLMNRLNRESAQSNLNEVLKIEEY